MVKFVTTSDNGNNLYLDNINLSLNHTVTGLKQTAASLTKITVYPNPTNGTTEIKMDNMKAGTGKVTSNKCSWTSGVYKTNYIERGF